MYSIIITIFQIIISFSSFDSCNSSSVKSVISALEKYSLADNPFLFLFLFHQTVPPISIAIKPIRSDNELNIFLILYIFVKIFFINKMSSEVKEFFTAAKALTPKATCIEFAYKLFNGSKGVSDVFHSQYNKLYLSDDYPNLLKQQNIVFACIGKPNTQKRSEFENKIVMNENKKTIDAYNNLLKKLNIKTNSLNKILLILFYKIKILELKRVNHLILIDAMK